MIPSLLAMVLFAVSSVSARRSVAVFGPATANFLRQILAVLLLNLFVLWLGSGFSGPALSWFLWSGVVGYGLGDAGVFLALPRLGSRLTSLMTQCLAAPIGALLEWAWLGQSPTGIQVAAGATILSGVFLALVPRRGSPWAGSEWKSGVGFGLLAALGQSGGAVLSRHGFEAARQAGAEAHPMTVTLQRALAGLVVGALWYGVARLRSGPVPLRPAIGAGGGWLLANALAGPTLGVVCYQWALARHPVSEVLPVVAMVPLAVIPLAYWLERERPTRLSLLGGVVAVAGVVLLARRS
ncbi:MAG: hypothetical protein RIT19_2729 [Verrucomicrobiota bacterium]|jgi:drug/metabolite transporter (DMT)-like permease